MRGTLNEQQRAAAEYMDGPLLVIAGAGSGKTRVITAKMIDLIKEKKYRPNEILAITFTRKAAAEMRDRVEMALSIKPRWILTFHSACIQMLRQDIEALGEGYTRQFVIYDTHDSTMVIKDALKSLNMKPAEANAVRITLSNAKQEYHENLYDYVRQLPYPQSSYSAAIQIYQETLRRSNALDYDDIILLTARLFLTRSDIRRKWQNIFRYYMVDEFQDTNKIQYLLLQLLAGETRNIMVVGDYNQAIYSFRGAHPENVAAFVRDFDAHEIKLEKNYRSTKEILDVANAVISRSESRMSGKVLRLHTDSDIEGEIQYAETEDGHQETFFVADKINSLVKQGYKYSDMAILLRMSFLSLGFEKTFMSRGIPYAIIKGLAFYDRAETKDLLAYLRFMLNTKDKAAFERIINVPPRSIGGKTLSQIKDSYNTDWLQSLRDVSLPPRARMNADRFIATIEKYAPGSDVNPYNTLLNLIDDIGYEAYLKKKYKEDFEDRMLNVSELLNVLKELETEGKTFSEFMEDSLLSSAQDTMSSEDLVSIMTSHSAKGLEFPVVFICGLEEEIFPAQKSMFSSESLEEERRLFYVSVTRAKEKLFMSSAVERMKFGQTNYQMASRYIDEIKEHVEMTSFHDRRPVAE